MRKGMLLLVVLFLLALIPSAGLAGTPPCAMDEDMPMMGYGPGMMGCGMGYGRGMGYGMGHGSGMMGYGMGMMGYGMGFMGLEGPYGMLDLTDEQEAKIDKLLDGLKKQHLEIMGKMMDQQAKMRDLFREEKLDMKKIGAVYDAFSALRKQLLEARVNATNRIREILTKEQRDELKQLYRGRGYGMGPGMGGGKMRRGMMNQ